MRPLIGGTAAGDRYAAAGALVENGSESAFCTATLVTKSFVITAKHCLEGGAEDEPADHEPAQVTFRLGADVSRPARKVTLKRWLPAPTSPSRTTPCTRAT